jgi:hypothetical protein
MAAVWDDLPAEIIEMILPPWPFTTPNRQTYFIWKHCERQWIENSSVVQRLLDLEISRRECYRMTHDGRVNFDNLIDPAAATQRRLVKGHVKFDLCGRVFKTKVHDMNAPIGPDDIYSFGQRGAPKFEILIDHHGLDEARVGSQYFPGPKAIIYDRPDPLCFRITSLKPSASSKLYQIEIRDISRALQTWPRVQIGEVMMVVNVRAFQTPGILGGKFRHYISHASTLATRVILPVSTMLTRSFASAMEAKTWVFCAVFILLGLLNIPLRMRVRTRFWRAILEIASLAILLIVMFASIIVW